MITVNGLLAGGMGGVGEWGDECSVNGGDGERLLSKLFRNNIDGRSCNNGSRQFIPVFQNPHRKCIMVSVKDNPKFVLL